MSGNNQVQLVNMLKLQLLKGRSIFDVYDLKRHVVAISVVGKK